MQEKSAAHNETVSNNENVGYTPRLSTIGSAPPNMPDGMRNFFRGTPTSDKNVNTSNQVKLNQSDSNQARSMPTNEKKYQYLDDYTISLLKHHHSGDNLELVKSQMNTIMGFIETNSGRYTYSNDFRTAIDEVIALIVAGKFLNMNSEVKD